MSNVMIGMDADGRFYRIENVSATVSPLGSMQELEYAIAVNYFASLAIERNSKTSVNRILRKVFKQEGEAV